MQNIYIELLFENSFFLKITPKQTHGFNLVLDTEGAQEIRENDRCMLWTDELACISAMIVVRSTKLLVVDNTEIV